MTNNQIVTELYKNHNKWLSIMKSFGDDIYTEDLVQEFYIRMLSYGNESKLFIHEKPNFRYIYHILLNIFKTYKNQTGNIHKVEITELNNISTDETDNLKHEKENELFESIESTIKSLDVYHKAIWTCHVVHGKSYRDIEKATDINKDKVCAEMKKIKSKIFLTYSEDWTDFKNNEFERINL